MRVETGSRYVCLQFFSIQGDILEAWPILHRLTEDTPERVHRLSHPLSLNLHKYFPSLPSLHPYRLPAFVTLRMSESIANPSLVAHPLQEHDNQHLILIFDLWYRPLISPQKLVRSFNCPNLYLTLIFITDSATEDILVRQYSLWIVCAADFVSAPCLLWYRYHQSEFKNRMFKFWKSLLTSQATAAQSRKKHH